MAASFSASECAHSGVGPDRIHVGHLAPEIAGDQAQADGTSGGLLSSRVAFPLLCRNRKLLHIPPPLMRIPKRPAYPLQVVRLSSGLIETVEPSSCPAAIGWESCA